MSAAEEAKQRGNDLFKRAKYSDAVQAYTESLSHEPESDVLLLNRSAAYMALGQYGQALADCERAVQGLSLIHISEPTRPRFGSRMPSSA